MISGVQVRRDDTSGSYVFLNIIPMCYMHSKGKYYKEYVTQYKRMSTVWNKEIYSPYKDLNKDRG